MPPSTFSKLKTSSGLLLIGIILIVLAVVLFFAHRIPSSYVRTTGTIVSQKVENIRRGGAGNTNYDETYFPTISFVANGTTYQFQGSGSTSTPPNFTVGQKVGVAYDPSNPNQSPKLTGDNGSVIFSAILGVVGLVLCFISIPRLLHKKNA
jgi:uncharacterized membrane protein